MTINGQDAASVLGKNAAFVPREDGGDYSAYWIRDVNLAKPGKYTVTAWHEDYGTQTQEVTVTGNETKTVDFTFKAKPY